MSQNYRPPADSDNIEPQPSAKLNANEAADAGSGLVAPSEATLEELQAVELSSSSGVVGSADGGNASDLADNATSQDDASKATPLKKVKPAKSFWREVLETVILTVMIFFLVKSLVQNFVISGRSMEPSFYNNQLLLVNKAAYFHFDINAWLRVIPGVKADGVSNVWVFGGPHRGDVIVFEYPKAKDTDFIKRVIGLPGETVEVKGGVVYINGQPINEPYIKDPPINGFEATKVPDNQVFVLGDNRNASSDSRSWGFLPVDKIIGKAMFVYWPLFSERWGIVPGAEYNK